MINKIINSSQLKYIIAIFYCYIFYKGYIVFLFKYFNYLGYDIINENINNLFLTLISFILLVLPLYFYKGVRKISSFLCVFIYYLVYVPVIFMFYFNYEGTSLVIYKQFLFFIGMIILFLADRFDLKLKLELPSSFNLYRLTFILGLIFSVILIIIFRNNLKLVSFEDVYSQRNANRDLVDGPVAYIYLWLANVILPICLTYGLYFKKRIYILASVFFALIMYMALAAKSVLLLPLIIYLLYRLLKNRSLGNSFNIIGFFLIILMIVSLQFDFNIYKSILWMRTLSISGYATKYYDLFFTNHPNTLYSHINIVNYLTQYYPYDKPLGSVVAREYFNENVNLNANFWATDGIAALGDFGVIFSSIILFFVFAVFNTIAKNYNLLFVVLLLIPFTLSLTNSSLFTSLVSGGAIFIFLFLSFTSIKKKYIE